MDGWRRTELYQAALLADWESFEGFLDRDKDTLTVEINENKDIALHLAVGAGRSTNAIDFVQKLVDRMQPEDLDIENRPKRTPLFNAAWMGNTKAVEILWEKRRSLEKLRSRDGEYGYSLLTMAASNAKKETLLYLLKDTKNEHFDQLFGDDVDSAVSLLICVITSGYYDVPKSHSRGGYIEEALDDSQVTGPRYRLLNSQVTGPRYHWPASRLVEYFISVPCIKHIQKQKQMHDQALELLKCFCERVRSQINDTKAYELHVGEAIHSAAKLGIHEVIEKIVESFPLVAFSSHDGYNFLQRAVKERHANVFNLIYQMGEFRHILVYGKGPSGNNLLHLAGGLPPKKLKLVSGAALQMQLELQWFQAVKDLMNPQDIESRNDDGKTPAMVFTENHETLVAEGEKWMKDTAKSCTIPSALIVTVAFAAAITFPGGINNTDGLAIFSKEAAFKIFIASDATSLFASITSLMVFLSILTLRYDEGDFLFVLPKRLIIGLATLFLSITAMVIAFCSTLYLMFGNNGKAWILYALASLAFIPIFSFTSLQFPLLRDLIMSTYHPGIFGKQSNSPFYGESDINKHGTRAHQKYVLQSICIDSKGS